MVKISKRNADMIISSLPFFKNVLIKSWYEIPRSLRKKNPDQKDFNVLFRTGDTEDSEYCFFRLVNVNRKQEVQLNSDIFELLESSKLYGYSNTIRRWPHTYYDSKVLSLDKGYYPGSGYVVSENEDYLNPLTISSLILSDFDREDMLMEFSVDASAGDLINSIARREKQRIKKAAKAKKKVK